MIKHKVHITTLPFGEKNIDLLSKYFEVSINPLGRKIRNEEVYEQVINADYIIAGTERYDSQLLKRLHNLKAISRVGIGIDNIDIETAERNKVKILNTPEEPAKAVAEYTLTLILNLLRNVHDLGNELKKSNWNRSLGKSLTEVIVGLVGGGRVAKKLCKLLISCGIKKINIYDVIDLTKDPELDHPVINICNFEECLQGSDIVSLHVPLSKKNKNMITKKEIGLMKRDSFLINVSRGGLINEEDLLYSLNNEMIKGAALDVFENEPYKGKLIECPNLICTPHIASSTNSVRKEMEEKACMNLISLIDESV